MSGTVGIATWDKRWPIADEEDDLLIGALADEGIRAQRVVWSEAKCPALAACVVRTTWDYVDHLSGFLDWLDDAATRTTVLNDPRLIRWNADKHYLLDLAAKGVTIPATVAVSSGRAPDLGELLRERSWTVAMLKPMVGVGAIGSFVARADDIAPAQAHLEGLLARGDVIVQPYLRSIHHAGEVSIALFDGHPSHAVRKVPAAGDYRAHPYWGATVRPVEPSAAQLAVADAALAATGKMPLYARVDLVELDDGAPAVMELELIEPYLFLGVESARRFAQAIAARLPIAG